MTMNTSATFKEQMEAMENEAAQMQEAVDTAMDNFDNFVEQATKCQEKRARVAKIKAAFFGAAVIAAVATVAVKVINYRNSVE